jgi:hypothetical protein
MEGCLEEIAERCGSGVAPLTAGLVLSADLLHPGSCKGQQLHHPVVLHFKCLLLRREQLQHQLRTAEHPVRVWQAAAKAATDAATAAASSRSHRSRHVRCI